jgi:hypothetical protein
MIEATDFGELQRQRKDAAEQTMRAVTPAEVTETLEKVFLNNSSHPWAKRTVEFAAEHKADTILSAELPEGYHVIFYPEANKGLWYKTGARLEGIGMLQPSALEKLCAIAREKGLA